MSFLSTVRGDGSKTAVPATAVEGPELQQSKKARRGRRAVALAGLMTLGAAWIAPTSAQAATPQVDHSRVDVSLPGIDQCGFTVNSVVRGTDTFQIFVDPSGNLSFQDVAHITSTLTNVANGKVVYVDQAGRDAWSDTGVVNPDGTTTFTDHLTGRDLRIYTSHSSVLLQDVGYLSIVDTFDAQGDFLDESVVEQGPHQFAGDFSAYCQAITTAIG